MASSEYTTAPSICHFAIYFISCLGFSLFHLTRKLLSLTGLQRLQVRYLFVGVLVAAVGATIANLIIPLLLGRSQFSRYGPLFGMLMVAVIAHAIIRYRLMDIKVVIQKSVVYVCAILASALVFVLASEALKRLGAYQRDSISIPEALMVSILMAIAFQPLKGLIHTSLNRYLYRETYDYQRTVRDASHRLSTMLDLDPIARLSSPRNRTHFPGGERRRLSQSIVRTCIHARLPQTATISRLSNLVPFLTFRTRHRLPNF